MNKHNFTPLKVEELRISICNLTGSYIQELTSEEVLNRLKKEISELYRTEGHSIPRVQGILESMGFQSDFRRLRNLLNNIKNPSSK